MRLILAAECLEDGIENRQKWRPKKQVFQATGVIEPKLMREMRTNI